MHFFLWKNVFTYGLTKSYITGQTYGKLKFFCYRLLQIIQSLDEDPAAQNKQLTLRLQQIAAALENKVTDLWPLISVRGQGFSNTGYCFPLWTQRRTNVQTLPNVWSRKDWNGRGYWGHRKLLTIKGLKGEQFWDSRGFRKCYNMLRVLETEVLISTIKWRL